jgi:ribosome recycling factor
MPVITNYKDDLEKIVAHAKQEMGALRTGRATSALVENITVEIYGARQSIKAVGSIIISDAKTIWIDVWDKNTLKDVERAISQANVGLMPIIDNNRIRLSLPPMTEDNRKDMVKILNAKLEESRISMRGVRDKVKTSITDAERAKEITDDDRYSLVEKLDGVIKEYISKIDELGEAKEEEIMTI